MHPQLHYEEHVLRPEADWMVLVHGAGGSTRTWKKQINDFSQHFNLLVVDLRDHGQSKLGEASAQLEYTLESIAGDVVALLQQLQIHHCHFMGVSLGSIIVRCIEIMQPRLVKSVILVGGIFKINGKINLLLQSGLALAHVLPFQTLYKVYAWIVLPRNNHKSSRRIFIREAQNLTPVEFRNWLRVTRGIHSKLREAFSTKLQVPYLVVMGAQDHVFLEPAREFTQRYQEVSLEVIDRCGHVCNIERAEEFNGKALSFLQHHFACC